jgi:hypothetical protein
MNEEHQRHMWSQRPMLLHTKSDTHITRWSSNCADRAASPLQVIATKQGEGSQLRSQLFVNGRLHPPALQLPSYSNSSIYSYSPFDDTSNSISPALSDDHKNGGPSDSDVTPTPSAGLPSAGKRKHISFNTFVEQCIAIEKPKKSSSSARGWRGAIGGFDPDDSYDEG